MSSQSDLVAMLAHDIRGPLSLLSGGLDELASPSLGNLSEEQRNILELVRRGARQIEALSDQLLQVSELDQLSLRLEDTDLAELVSSVVEQSDQLPVARNKDIEVFAPDSLVAPVDAGLLWRVIQNLLSNALRYAEQTVQVTLRGKGPWVELIVDDDGPGIDETLMPRIFDRFVRGDAGGQDRGLGLGLAIVRQLVEVHGGSVEARNHDRTVEGPGARFTVCIPRRESRAPT